MKNLSLLLLLASAILLNTSCNKDDDSQPTYFITAKVDGTDYTAGTILATKTNSVIIINGQESLLQIGGINLTFLNEGAEGTYDFATNNTEVVAAYATSDGNTDANADTGTVTITNHDTTGKIISGTFQFSGNDINSGNLVEVTEGEFNIQYLE